MRTASFGHILAAVALAGCGAMRSTPLEVGSTAASGVPYYLPMRTFDIDAKFVISNCKAVELEPEEEGGPVGQVARLSYDVKPTVKTQLVADRSQMFIIDKGLTPSALKATELNIQTYENGTLKAINSIVDDRTAQTATNILSGGLKIALGAAIPTGYSAGDGTALREITLESIAAQKKAAVRTADEVLLRKVCGDRVVDALKKVRELTALYDGALEAQQVKAKNTAAVEAAAKAVTDARAAFKAAKEAGSTSDVNLAEKDLSEAVSKLIKARSDAAAPSTAETTTTLTQRIAAVVDRHLTLTSSRTFAPDASKAFNEVYLTVPKEDLKGRGIEADHVLRAHAVLNPLDFVVDRIDSPDHAAAANVPSQGGSATTAATNKKTPSSASGTGSTSLPPTSKQTGLFYRTPLMAKLRVCVDSCPQIGGASPRIRFDENFTIPQKGQLVRLPLSGALFARSDAKIQWAPDGNLTSFGLTSTSSAETASKAFADAGASLLDYAQQRQTLLKEIATADSAAEKAALQQELDLLNLRADIAAAQSSRSPRASEQAGILADLDHEIEVTRRQQELLKERRKLNELEAETAGNEP